MWKERNLDADAKSRRGIGEPRMEGRGEITQLVNNSIFYSQTQNEDSLDHSTPYCIAKMCLSPSGALWCPLAFLYSGAEPIKAGASSQPSVDYTTFYSQHLCEEGSRPHQHTWNSKALLFFPAEILLHIVYISNILCGLEVIDSRRLQ